MNNFLSFNDRTDKGILEAKAGKENYLPVSLKSFIEKDSPSKVYVASASPNQSFKIGKTPVIFTSY